MALTRALRRILLDSLWEEKLLYIVLAAVVLIAMIEPAGFAGSALWYRLSVFLGASLLIVFYSVFVGCFICAKLGRHGVHMYFSATVNSFCCAALVVPLLLPFFPNLERRAELYSAEILVPIFSVGMIIACTSYIFISLLQGKLQSCFDAAGLKIDILPRRRRKKDPIQEMLPHRMRGTILSLAVQDKYLEVQTVKGSALVLTSLSNAVDLMKPDQGLRIHRSAWLNWQAMDRIVYDNGNPRLLDKRGQKWPVSRNQVNLIKSSLERRTATAAE